MVIANAKNVALNSKMGTVPDVSGALTDYFQAMVFTQVQKSTVAFQGTETPLSINFQGVIQPLNSRALQMKPEGQRAWTWFTLYADPSLTLDVDDEVTYLGEQTRIMSRQEFGLYGYVLYEIVQDWTGGR